MTDNQMYLDRPSKPSALWLLLVCALALVMGAIGSLASYALFPPARGVRGPIGLAGLKGPQGDQGPSGFAAALDLASIGYCFGTTSIYNGSNTYVTGVSLYPPSKSSGGAVSCPSGLFESLAPHTG